MFFFFKQKTAYEMRISDWSSDVCSSDLLGSGYVNPATLIAARLIDRSGHALDRSLFVHRLNVALALRQRRYAEPFYRLLYGESDGVPGLTVERMGDVVVAQATTAGIERLRGPLSEAIDKVQIGRAHV